jgi:elongation factor P--beta-lysine ligase
LPVSRFGTLHVRCATEALAREWAEEQRARESHDILRGAERCSLCEHTIDVCSSLPQCAGCAVSEARVVLRDYGVVGLVRHLPPIEVSNV